MRRPRRRALTLLAAGLVFALAGTAVAKKKKKHHHGTAKHKTSTTKSVDKDTEESSDTDEESPESTPAKGGAAKATGKTDTREGAGEAGGEEHGSPAETEGPKPKASAEVPEEGGAFVLPALELVVGGGGLFRNLTWHEDVTRALSAYKLAPGPEVRVGLEVYPAAFAGAGFLANLGVFGGFDYGFAVTSKTVTGVKLTTKFQDFLGGIKLRVPLGTFVPYASVAYGGQSFSLGGQGAAITVPGVNYKFIRGGLGARVWLTPALDVDVGGGYLLVTNLGAASGEIESSPFFPRAKAYAVDAGLSVGYRLTKLIGVRAGADFRQYGLSFHVQSGDPLITGGAVDRYVVAWGGLEIVLDSVPSGAAAASDDVKATEAPSSDDTKAQDTKSEDVAPDEKPPDAPKKKKAKRHHHPNGESETPPSDDSAE